MMLKSLVRTTALVLGCALAGSAAAQATAAQAKRPAADSALASRTASPTKQPFDKLDKEHRDYLVRSDIPSSMRDLRIHYTEADFDHDGRLSRAEYAHYSMPVTDSLLTAEARSAAWLKSSQQVTTVRNPTAEQKRPSHSGGTKHGN